MSRVVILIHRNQSLREDYLLHELAGVWREKGIEIAIAQGLGPRVEADVAILHVDLTIIPPDHAAWVRQYPVVINGAVADISKRRVSTNLVSRGDGYDGPVIVKTNCNCGAKQEIRLARKERPLREAFRSLSGKISWRWRHHLRPYYYPVFQSPRRVPRGVWRNPDLVVEQFLPERCGDMYCLRQWLFFGNREVHARLLSSQPIVKRSTSLYQERGDGVPDEIRQIRRDMGFDYGKFDYGIVDGRAVLYDVNRTPAGIIGLEPAERLLLSEGIQAYF